MSEYTPELSHSVYRGIVGDYIEIMGPHTEAPPAYLYAAFMASLGAGFPQVCFPWGNDQLPLTPYVLLYGKSGDRKTSSKRDAMETVEVALRGELRISTGMFTPEGATRILREASNVDMNLADPLANAKDPAVIFDVGEFTGLLKASQRVGNPLVELLLDGHSAPKHYSKTLSKQKDSTDLVRLRMAVIGDSTPEHLGTVMDRSHIHSGLFNRLDIFMGERGGPVYRHGAPDRRELTKKVIEPIRAVQNQWTNGKPNVRAYAPIDLTEEADEFLKHVYLSEVYPSMDDENSDLFRRFDVKMNVYGVLHALNEGSREVNLAHLEAGYEVAKHTKETALIAAGEVGKSDKTKLLDNAETLIKKAGPRGVKDIRMLQQRISKVNREAMKKYGLSKIVEQLVDDGLIDHHGDAMLHTDFTEGGER